MTKKPSGNQTPAATSTKIVQCETISNVTYAMDCLVAKKDQDIRDLEEKLDQTLAKIPISSPNHCDNESTNSPFYYVEKFESRKMEIQRDVNSYFPCDQCDYKSYVKIDIDNHYRTHTDEEPFGCNICKQRFKSKTSCIRHIRGHDNRFKISCGLSKSNLAKKEQEIRDLKEKLEQTV